MKIALACAPYCYSYTLPINIAYLKAIAQKYGHQAKCFDLSIEFYHFFNLFEEATDLKKQNDKYAKQSHLLDINNWNNKDNFYQQIVPSIQFQNWIEQTAERLIANDVELVGLSIFNTNLWTSLEIAKVIRRLKPHVKIVLGGPDCSSSVHFEYLKEIYQKLLTDNVFDVMVIGEGEESFIELLQAFEKAQNLSNIKGLMFLKDGQPFYTGMRPMIKDLDSLPFPNYDDLDFNLYPNSLILPLVFNRGCNFECAFCDVRLVWGEKSDFRHRSAKNIADEIKYLCTLIEGKNIGYAILGGSYINTSTRVLLELCDELIAFWGDKPKIKWEGWARINGTLTPEVCQKMAKAGCYSLVYGFESGSPKVCKDMNKLYSHPLAEIVLKNASEAGIDNTLFTIVGFPTETEEDFQMTLSFLERNALYIKRAYCMSEFLLSSSMASQPEKWNLAFPIDGYTWKTKDGLNSIEIRKDRLQRFYKHIEKLKLNV